MAKIKKRLRRNGQPSYTVEVRVSGVQSTKTFYNQKDARNWAIVTEAALREGRFSGSSRSGRKTLSDAIERFRYFTPPYAGEWLTGRSREHFLDFWDRQLGRLKLSDICPAHVVEGRDRLLKDKRSPATCNRYVSAISSVLQACVEEWYWLERNPARSIRRMKENNRRSRFLDDQELDRLLKSCKKDPELLDVVVLALSTGARRGELQALQWKDVDLKSEFITFRNTKNKTDRTIPIVSKALEMFKKRFRERVLGKGDWVFPAPKSEGYADFRHRFPRYVKQAEIKDFRFHDLRHTAASYLAAAGASERKIAEILGHKTLEMVKRYTHLRPEHLRDEMKMLGEAIIR